MTKQGTPTMGGLMFIIGIGITILVLGWRNMLAGDFSHLYVYVFSLVFGAIGFIDDYQKVKHHRNTGLTAPQKFILQLAAAVAFLCLMRYEGMLSPNLYIPFWNTHIVLPWIVYLIFAAFVIVGTVNAVNITDGLDGLSSSVTLPVAVFFTAVAVIWAGYAQLGTFSAALVGGLCGVPAVQPLPRQGVHGRHRLPVSGRRGGGAGLRLRHAAGADTGGHRVYLRDAQRHHPGGLFQTDPRQAHLQDGAPAPSL